MHKYYTSLKLSLSLSFFIMLYFSVVSNSFSNNYHINALNSTNIINPHNALLPNSIHHVTNPDKNSSTVNNSPKNSIIPSSPIQVVHNKNITSNPTNQTELKSMDVSIDKSGKNSNQKIIVNVKDSLSGTPINQASISGSINAVSFNGFTDESGNYVKKIPSDIMNSTETISVSVTAKADNYKTKKTETDFDNTPESPVIGEDNTKSPTSIKNNEDNNNQDNTNKDSQNKKDLSESIFDSVRKQLGDQGINIPLPFG